MQAFNHHASEFVVPTVVQECDLIFKANLCVHKSQQLKSEHYVSSVGNFWEVSERVLQRIESPSAVAGRDAFCEYLNDTPWVAKRKGINIYKTC